MLQQLIDQVLANRSVRDKLTIAQTYSALGDYVSYRDPFAQQAHQISWATIAR